MNTSSFDDAISASSSSLDEGELLIQQQEEPFSTWSTVKFLGLMITSDISCVISTIGSTCLIRIAYQKNLRQSSFKERLLISISICDIIWNIFWLIGHYLLPQSTNIPGALGNTTTCIIGGFLTRFLSVVSMYNTSLSIYFLLTVRYQWKDEHFTKYIEKPLLVMGILVFVGLGVFGIRQDLYNPDKSFFVCTYYQEDEEMDDNGKTAAMNGLVAFLYYGENLVFPVIGIIATVGVYYTVKKQIQIAQSYNFNGSQNNSLTRKLRLVRTQAMLYTAAYTNALLWVAASQLAFESSENARNAIWYYILLLCSAFFFFLNGFFNYWIYTRMSTTTRNAGGSTTDFFVPPSTSIVSRISAFCPCRRRRAGEGQHRDNRPNSQSSSSSSSPFLWWLYDTIRLSRHRRHNNSRDDENISPDDSIIFVRGDGSTNSTNLLCLSSTNTTTTSSAFFQKRMMIKSGGSSSSSSPITTQQQEEQQRTSSNSTMEREEEGGGYKGRIDIHDTAKPTTKIENLHEEEVEEDIGPVCINQELSSSPSSLPSTPPSLAAAPPPAATTTEMWTIATLTSSDNNDGDETKTIVSATTSEELSTSTIDA